MVADNTYWIYILECDNGSYYTGYTDDLVKRYRLHRSGKGGAKYTRSFKPVRIARCWKLSAEKGTAMKIENFIKSRERKEKEIIVADPGLLENLFSSETGISIEINPFDPEKIENEAKASDQMKRSGEDSEKK
jgi:putative endonuclease